MAKFEFKKVDETNTAEFNAAANQKAGGNGSSPFKEGATFVPSGKYCYLITNEGTDKQRYNLALEGTVANIPTYLWASVLLKVGFTTTNEEILPQGFNKVCRDANIGEMTNQQAGDWILSKLKKGDGSYHNLSAKRLVYTGFYNGQPTTRTLIEFKLV